MNIAYRCIDTFTVKVHDLHPVLEISNFLEMKLKIRCFSNSKKATILDWMFSYMRWFIYGKMKPNLKVQAKSILARGLKFQLGHLIIDL